MHPAQQLRAEGIDVGLVAKPTLNVIDEQAIAKVGDSPVVLVVESQNRNTGLGIRYGSWLLERGLTPRYAHMGSTKPGNGGLWEHMGHQGIDPDSNQQSSTSGMRRIWLFPVGSSGFGLTSSSMNGR